MLNLKVIEHPNFKLAAALFLTVLYVIFLHNGYWGLGFTILNSLLLMLLLFNPKIAKSKECLAYIGFSFILSFLIAIRSFSFGHYLSILAVLFLNCLAVTKAGEQEHPLSVKHIILAPLKVLAGVVIEPVREINRIFKRKESIDGGHVRGSATAALLVKGALIAVPILALFIALFALADPLFEHYLNQIISSLNFSLKLPAFWEVVVVAIAFGTFLSYLQIRALSLSEFSQWQLVTRHKAEVAVAVGSIALLFAAFLIVQAQYLFATDEILKQMGVMYSEYTRRGYAELLVISAISLGLTSILVSKRGVKERQALISLVVIFLAEVFLILLSATRRNFLYQDQFGFTQIRLIGFVISVWLTSVLIVYALRALNKIKSVSIFPLLFFLSIGSLILLNAINIDYLVGKVRQPNLGYTIDYAYITGLSSDAWPGWEDTLTYLETTKECRISQEYESVFNLSQHLEQLRQRDDNNWHNLGSLTYSDAQALEFLSKNESRLKVLESKFANCAVY
jgi:hypothetical protein